jgi:hypothetical protein
MIPEGVDQLVQESPAIGKALEVSSGARFFRCALQVNPYGYLAQHNKQSEFPDEAAYNDAVVTACVEAGIEVIAVTDHYRIQSAGTLIARARLAGLHVLPGFEASTKDGVHLLCLFDADTGIETIERIIGDCGIHTDDAPSPNGKYDTVEFLDHAKGWGAATIAAHVSSASGLLQVLNGQPRVAAWTNSNMIACSIPGPLEEAPANLRKILENREDQYRKQHGAAILNARDVNGPAGAREAGASCWIKMVRPSVEGLRQAFLDPESRIRLASDAPSVDHSEFVAMSWEGGFLDGLSIHFNENLNVLIGGRGAGKSSIVESLRYVLDLDAPGTDAKNLHEGIVKNVLRPSTKISLLIKSQHPSPRYYLVERSVPNPPIVRGDDGSILHLKPKDVLPNVELFGQHEISELTKSPEQRTRLLERFVTVDATVESQKQDLRKNLAAAGVLVHREIQELDEAREKLDALPSLEERLGRFSEAGIESQLKDQAALVSEERVLDTADERTRPIDASISGLAAHFPLNADFLSDKALDDLPAGATLRRARAVLADLTAELQQPMEQMRASLKRARESLGGIRVDWNKRKTAVDQEEAAIILKLQLDKVDGKEFLRLKRRVEELTPLKADLAAHQSLLEKHLGHRQSLLAKWEDAKTKEFRGLESAAKSVNHQLGNRVQVTVEYEGNRERLVQLLRQEVKGRLTETIEALTSAPTLSLKELADTCRIGKDDLASKFHLPLAQAQKVADCGESLMMAIEELELPATTTIKLNVSPEETSPFWQDLGNLSTGQKATAVLLLLLLESDAPLVVDQPEDDLDNRFITEGIVPNMRKEKLRRQFLFATHNANIPVLGDAELILGLSAVGEASDGHATVLPAHMGSIDSGPIRDLVEEILEGGPEAFQVRRLKYGF